MSSARMSPMRDWSGAAQKAAHISALNFGWVWVSVCVIDARVRRGTRSFNYPRSKRAFLSHPWPTVAAMTLSVENITFDCTDPDRLAEWWAGVVDGTGNALAPGLFVTVSRPRGPRRAFQKVVHPTPGKNRVP